MPRPPRPTDAPAPPAPRRSPWPLAIALGLSVVVAANAAFVWVALTHSDPIVASYSIEKR